MEIWKDIKNYEGLYQVSNLGRVKSLPKTWVACNNTVRNHNGVILKCCKSNGYVGVALMKNGGRFQTNVHRLVVDAFLDKDNERDEVNHKNGNRSDNRVDNLEWVTHSENIQHADRTGLRVMPKGEKHFNFGKKGEEASRSKIVLDTQTGIYYGSTKEAADSKCINRNTLAHKLIGFRKNNTSLIYV